MDVLRRVARRTLKLGHPVSISRTAHPHRSRQGEPFSFANRSCGRRNARGRAAADFSIPVNGARESRTTLVISPRCPVRSEVDFGRTVGNPFQTVPWDAMVCRPVLFDGSPIWSLSRGDKAEDIESRFPAGGGDRLSKRLVRQRHVAAKQGSGMVRRSASCLAGNCADPKVI